VRFQADLTIDQGDNRVVLTGDDGVLVITGKRLGTIARAMRSGTGLPNLGLRQVSDRLAEVGATVRLETTSAPVLTLGERASPQLITRLMRAPHVRIESARGLLGTLPPAAWGTALAIIGSAVVAVAWHVSSTKS